MKTAKSEDIYSIRTVKTPAFHMENNIFIFFFVRACLRFALTNYVITVVEMKRLLELVQLSNMDKSPPDL